MEGQHSCYGREAAYGLFPDRRPKAAKPRKKRHIRWLRVGLLAALLLLSLFCFAMEASVSTEAGHEHWMRNALICSGTFVLVLFGGAKVYRPRPTKRLTRYN